MSEVRFDGEYTESSQQISSLRDVRTKCTPYNICCMFYRAGIIKQEIECPKCNDGTMMEVHKTKSDYYKDGYLFYCKKLGCKTRRTIKMGSIFHLSRKPLGTLSDIIYAYCKAGYTQKISSGN